MSRTVWRINALFALLLTLNMLIAPLRSGAQTPLGGGLNGPVDYGLDHNFVDTVQIAGPPYALNSSGGLDLTTLAPIDAKGYPTSDFGLYINETNSLAGTYHFIGEFDNATSAPTLGIQLFSGSINNLAWNAATHILTADVTNTNANGVIVLTLKNTGGNVQQLHFIQPGYPATNWPIYATPWLTHLTTNNPTVLRFMDFHDTNNNAEMNWADRSTPSFMIQNTPLSQTGVPSDGNYPTAGTFNGTGIFNGGRGICWEYTVALGNLQNKDIWINVPALATKDYVTKLANLIKYGSDGTNPYTSTQASPVWAPLNSGLHVWLEYSNEVWNDSFDQAHINRGLGLNEVASGTSWGGNVCKLDYDSINDVNQIGDRRVADHLKEMSDIFKGVFGASAINTTVRPILAYQLAPNRFSNQLAYIDAVYGSPKTYFYGLAVAPYFNLNGADTSTTLSSQDVLNALASSIATYQTGPSLTQIATISTFYGIKMCAYEGGPDTFGPNNIAAKKAASLDPQMQTLVVNYLNTWYSHGGDQFNWFTLGAGTFDSQYGTYSITDDITDLNQPKELGYRQVRIETRPAVTTGFAVPGEADARYSLYGPGSVNSGGYYIRFIGSGSTFDYLFNAPTAGTYKISVSAGDGNSASAPLDILLNDTLVQTVTVAAAAGNQFADTTPISITLSAGLNTVRLRVPDNRPYNINSVKITKADGTGITNTLPQSSFYEFYPTISANTTYSNTFEVHDNESPSSAITVTATSDNQTLIPNANIQVLTGSYNVYGTILNRQLNILPAPDQTGIANISVTITDGGGLSRVMTFKLTVNGGFTGSPVNLTATPGNNQVVLNWQQATSGAGGTSFNIYRGTMTGGPYDEIASGRGGFTYTDTTAVNGTTYYYVVTGVSGIGGESGYSNEASATPFLQLPAPVLTAQGYYQTVRLTWTPVAGAVSYNVKRANTPAGPFSLIGSTTTPTTTLDDMYLNPGTTYSYIVVAVNSFGGEGIPSNVATATTGITNIPGEIEARLVNIYGGGGLPGYNQFASCYARFIGSGSDFHYQINVAAAGTYKLSVSAGEGPGGPLNIQINGGTAQTVTVASANDGQFFDTTPITATFTQGVNTFDLIVPGNRPYDLNTIKITNADGSGLPHTLPFCSFYEFYPSTNANTPYVSIFNVYEDGTQPAFPQGSTITLKAVSDNPVLVPNANIVITRGTYTYGYGDKENTQMTVTPAPGQSGQVSVYLTITNSYGLSRTVGYRLTVNAAATTTVTGRIALEGVSSLANLSPGAPLGTFHVSFRTPGTTTEDFGADVSLTNLGATGTFTIAGVPAGTYDVNIKGSKNLSFTNPGVVISSSSMMVPDTTLGAGDSDNNNVVDTTDFNTLVGVFGNLYDPNQPNTVTGYDPTVDFDFNGAIDTGDFNLLVGQFGNSGS